MSKINKSKTMIIDIVDVYDSNGLIHVGFGLVCIKLTMNGPKHTIVLNDFDGNDLKENLYTLVPKVSYLGIDGGKVVQ